jgi:hypothetical protein
MKKLRVSGGQYGLGGFYDTIIVPIVDEVEGDHPSYDELLDIAKRCCSALAQKISNHFKVR